MYLRWRHARLLGVVALALLGAIGAARAQSVTVLPTITSGSGLFHYDYAVTNDTDQILSILTLEGLPATPLSVQNLTAPAGFMADFDTGLGLLSFFEDTQAFDPHTTVSGFAFDSPYGPGPGAFSALDIQGGLTVGAAIVPVPEPGASALLLSLVPCGAWTLRRKLNRKGVN